MEFSTMTIYKEKKENIFTHEVTVFDYTGKKGMERWLSIMMRSVTPDANFQPAPSEMIMS